MKVWRWDVVKARYMAEELSSNKPSAQYFTAHNIRDDVSCTKIWTALETAQ